MKTDQIIALKYCEENLLPCPFCGGSKDVKFCRYRAPVDPSWKAGCLSCRIFTETTPCLEDAAKAWNHRDRSLEIAKKIDTKMVAAACNMVGDIEAQNNELLKKVDELEQQLKDARLA